MLKLEKPTNLTLVTTQSYNYKDNHHFAVHPYINEDILSVATKYGIKVPFQHITTKDQGTSKCSKCGAVYAGHQPICTREIRYAVLKEAGSSYTKEVPSETYVVGQRITINETTYHSSRYEVTSIKLKECGGLLIWDLEKEFYKQCAFFSMLETIQNIHDTSPLTQFSDCFLPGVKEHLDNQLMSQNIQLMFLRLEQHHNALQQIANKMNQAGQCLSF